MRVAEMAYPHFYCANDTAASNERRGRPNAEDRLNPINAFDAAPRGLLQDCAQVRHQMYRVQRPDSGLAIR